MWTGVPGTKFGSRVDKTVGSRRIVGPEKWKHPVTGQNLTIYIRTNGEKKGQKIQYYTMRSDGRALARVFDRRPGQSDRYFVGDAFFPLGNWRDGKSREFRLSEYQDGKVKKYVTTLKVVRASHKARGKRNSVKYEWISRKPIGRKVFHERYIYSPRVGFVAFKNQM